MYRTQSLLFPQSSTVKTIQILQAEDRSSAAEAQALTLPRQQPVAFRDHTAQKLHVARPTKWTHSRHGHPHPHLLCSQITPCLIPPATLELQCLANPLALRPPVDRRHRRSFALPLKAAEVFRGSLLDSPSSWISSGPVFVQESRSHGLHCHSAFPAQK